MLQGRARQTPPQTRARRLCRRTTLRTIEREGNHEQHASEYASKHASGWRPTAALRSANELARVSRAAKGRMARTTRYLARAASRMESELRGHLRPARTLHDRPDHPGVCGRNCAAHHERPSRRGHVLDVVRPVVAAA